LNPLAIPQPVAPSAEFGRTLKLFTAKRFQIEASVAELAHAAGHNPEYLLTAHKFLGDNIIATLHLGDMTYLNSEIDWLHPLLENQNLPASVVYDYLGLYAAAVRQHLDGFAPLVTDWLAGQINQH
jgi:hypothetical protein